MTSLLDKKCTACELGAPLVPDEKQNDLLKEPNQVISQDEMAP